MRAWLLCACAVAAAAPAGLEETADRLSRVVRIFDAAANLPGAAAPLVIRDAEGRAYACDAGGSAADSARPALAGYLTWRSAQACATWAARGSYWSYEVCFGNSPSVSQTSKDTQRTLLGAPSQRPPEARSTETLRGGIFADILTDANVLLGGGPVVVERFEGGFQGRSADVYVFCGVVDVPDATEAKRRGALVAAAPLIYKIVEEPEKLYHVAVVAPKACDDAELAKLALRYETRTLRHRCATRRVHGEWWTFEVCLGGQVSQFRQDEATGEREGGFVIGSYSATVENDTTNATRPRLTELYYGGDLCDLTKSPRLARVHYECAADDADARRTPFRLVSVTETATCEYEMVVSLANVAAASQSTTRRNLRREAAQRKHIDCVPVDAPL